MEVKLPQNVGLRNPPALFAVCSAVASSDDVHIVLDASEVEFVDPFGLAVLGALLGPLSGRRVTMPWLHVMQAGYLQRMNFFEHVHVEGVELPAWGRNDLRNRLTELTRVDSHADCDDAADRLANAITGTLTEEVSHPDDYRGSGSQHERFKYPLWYSLSELLQNSLTHAQQGGRHGAKVWVAAQYFERTGEVTLAVVDNGCGMLETLRREPELVEQSHIAAIKAALQPKVSCNRDGRRYNTQGNEGVGLTTTARIAQAAEGGLTIVSGNGLHRTQRAGHSVVMTDGEWPGVAISFRCKRSRLPSIRVSELLPPKTNAVHVNFSD